MSWLQKLLPPKIQRTGSGARKTVPEGLWTKCAACDAVLYSTDLEKNLNVCPKCGHHERLGARPRLDALLDADGRFEIGSEVLPLDPLKFKDSRRYSERLAEAQEETAEGDALVVMQGAIKSLGVVCSAFEFDFMGGSMGSVVGERFVRGVRVAIEQKLPFICVTASGGARMQEGALSLVQMAKTTAALTDLAERGLPFVSVLSDPTMGGVSASFAMIGDVVIAEPKALIGFAGPRVIEQTVRQKLPEGFQRAEFLLEKGAIDMIVDRRQLRDRLHSVLSLLQGLPAETRGVTLLAEVVRASAAVAATSSRLAKIRIIADCLRALAPEEVEIALPWLSGDIRQGKLALGYATLQAVMGQAADSATLTVSEVDAAFQKLKTVKGKGSSTARQAQLRDLFGKATAEEQDFLLRLIVGELRQGALEGVMLEALAAAAEHSRRPRCAAPPRSPAAFRKWRAPR